jgi:hypothetical protein
VLLKKAFKHLGAEGLAAHVRCDAAEQMQMQLHPTPYNSAEQLRSRVRKKMRVLMAAESDMTVLHETLAWHIRKLHSQFVQTLTVAAPTLAIPLFAGTSYILIWLWRKRNAVRARRQGGNPQSYQKPAPSTKADRVL